MKSYVCDICGIVIDKPHSMRMKEFAVGYTHEVGIGAIPLNVKTRRKIHMCEPCWHEFLRTCEKRKERDL